MYVLSCKFELNIRSRSAYLDWGLTDNKPHDSISKFRSATHDTPAILSRNIARTDTTYHSNSAGETYTPSAKSLKTSNSTTGHSFRAPTPRAEKHQLMSSSYKTYHSALQNPRSSCTDTKAGPVSYHTDKYFSKHFLSSSMPLSEMMIKHT